MKILFIHQNFPGQFKYLAPALVELGHKVRALRLDSPPNIQNYNGVEVTTYTAPRNNTPALGPNDRDFESKVIRAEGVANVLARLKQQGYEPDVVVAHIGWGEALHVKWVFPNARLLAYCEFYYRLTGQDVGFDPEFEKDIDTAQKIRISYKNFNNDLMAARADAGVSPTEWQRCTYPEIFREKITTIHEGINTEDLQRSESLLRIRTQDGNELILTAKDQIVTYVSRNLEPYRGFHSFMRSLPKILRDNNSVRVLIVGGDSVSYGSGPNLAKHGADSWRKVYASEVFPLLHPAERERIHFFGKVPYETYKLILSVSSVHIYLTYPFVLSWSLLEAMSMRCSIVASNTAPLAEVIEDGVNGVLVDFFKYDEIANRTLELLRDAELRGILGEAARNTVVSRYDLHSVCLPRQIEWVVSGN